MKRTGLFLVFFMFFIAVNGFCRGQSEVKKLQDEVVALQLRLNEAVRNTESSTPEISQMLQKISELENKLEGHSHGQPPTPPPSQPTFNRYDIEGSVSLSSSAVTAIVNFIDGENTTLARADIQRIINFYVSEAQIEGINVYLAIAQMLHATEYLNNGRRSTSNYAGFNIENTTASEWGGERGRFHNSETGVKAHIQHLKRYSSGTLSSGSTVVDPRWNLVLSANRGTTRTLNQLASKWVAPSSSSNYERSIRNIIDRLCRETDA